MPEHWQKESEEKVKGIEPLASSLVVNSTNAAWKLVAGTPTVAGNIIEELAMEDFAN